MEWAKHTAFVSAVCQGLRPRVSGCSAEMKALIAACWHANPSSRPCLSSFSLFFHASHLFFLVFFHSCLLFACTYQHLMLLLTHSVLSIDSPCSLFTIITNSHLHSLFLTMKIACHQPSVPCLQCHPHRPHEERCVNCHSTPQEWLRHAM